MEASLFTWDDWQEIETAVFVFTKCVVINAFGDFKVGQELEYVLMNVSAGIFETGYFIDGEKHKMRYRMNFYLTPMEEVI